MKFGREHGQAVGFVMVTVALVMALGLGLASLSIGLVQQSRAQNAADASALAGAAGGLREATRAAERNGGRVSNFERVVDADVETVTVTVEVGGRSATARASDTP